MTTLVGPQHAGTVRITSGRLHIGDPCYTLTRDSNHRPRASTSSASDAFDKAVDFTTRDVAGIRVASPYDGPPGIGAVLTGLPEGEFDVTANIADFGGADTRVVSLTVHLDATRDISDATEVHLDDLGVDAGLMWVGDPADFVGLGSPVDSQFGDWMAFCEAIEDVRLYATPCGWGHGVVSSTGFGDGVYPLTAHVARGDVLVALTVTFIDDATEEE